MVQRLQLEGHEVFVVDQSSEYPPLLDWYATKPCEVIKGRRNGSQYEPWDEGAIDRMIPVGGYYAESDPDLDLSGVPVGFVEHLVEGFETHRVINVPSPNIEITKAALSLRLDDVPPGRMREIVLGQETYGWLNRVDAGYYFAGTDSTFAVYRKIPPGKRYVDWYRSIRSAPPYTARHMPWYVDAARMPEDYSFYLRHSRGFGIYARYLAEAIGVSVPHS
jgi:hypothetical protein